MYMGALASGRLSATLKITRSCCAERHRELIGLSSDRSNLASQPDNRVACTPFVRIAIKAHAPLPARSAVRPGRNAAGDRTEERKTVRPAARQAAGRAGRRRAVPSAPCDARPARRGRRSATRSRTPSSLSRRKVAEHREPPSPRSRAPFKVLVEDDTGDVELVFFLANHRMGARAPAGRRDALDLRQARAVGRPAARSSIPTG